MRRLKRDWIATRFSSECPFPYDANAVRTLTEMFERADRSGSDRMEEQILAPYRKRMGDVSVFMKELKQRFSQ